MPAPAPIANVSDLLWDLAQESPQYHVFQDFRKYAEYADVNIMSDAMVFTRRPYNLRLAYHLSQMAPIFNNASWWRNAARFNHSLYYYDLCVRGAFTNVTDFFYSIARSVFHAFALTFMGNVKEGNGRFPDENFAREIMQLFIIGLNRVDDDGRTTADETYTQDDVKALARLFTGVGLMRTVNFADPPSSADLYRADDSAWNPDGVNLRYPTTVTVEQQTFSPLFAIHDIAFDATSSFADPVATIDGTRWLFEHYFIDPDRMDPGAITLFAGTPDEFTIPAMDMTGLQLEHSTNSSWPTIQLTQDRWEARFRLAIEGLCAHSNVRNFQTQQMIARNVSNVFSPEYFRRVRSAYDSGTYTLRDGRAIGDGTPGNWQAVRAAAIADPEANADHSDNPDWGRWMGEWLPAMRVLRILVDSSVQFDTYAEFISYRESLDPGGVNVGDWAVQEHLYTLPLSAPTVFGFWDFHDRPSDIGTDLSEGVEAPELTTLNTLTDTSYADHMASNNGFIDRIVSPTEFLWNRNPDHTVPIDIARFLTAAQTSTAAMIDLMNTEFCGGRMHPDTVSELATAVGGNPADSEADRLVTFKLALQAIYRSPAFRYVR